MPNASSEPASLDRIPAREHAQQLPEPVPDAVGMYRVDATWGTIQPMEVAAGVRTVGELDVIDQLQAGLPVIDARTSDSHERATLPGALNMPHAEAVERMDELDRTRPTVFFCNGPQCAQSPWAITALLEAGYPPAQILYYRGGMHDWVTLGLPTVPGTSDA